MDGREARGGRARRLLRLFLLRVLPLVTILLVALRAAGYLDRGRPTPRQLAGAFLAGATPGGEELTGRAPAPPSFTDVAPELGLRFDHDNAFRGNFLLPEEMGPGVAFLEADGDGDLDVFVAGGGAIVGDGPVQTCRLFRNDGERFTDVTQASGAGIPGPAYGVACADHDDDGDVDIFVSRLGPDALLRNDGGLRFSEDAAEAGVNDPGFGASAAFLDFDRDGRLDLYVARYVDWAPQRETPCYAIAGTRDYCNPRTYEAPSRDKLYRNLGGGRFEDVSGPAGIAAEPGNGLGVLACDFDGDGWIDIYVANDQTPAFLWHNRGDGTFANIAPIAGCAYDGRGVAIAGMGAAGEDLDGDGDTDVLVTNIRQQTHLVLRNDDARFEDVSLSMGLARWSLPATAFGVAVFDQDNDGRFDAFFANGEVNIDNSMPVGDNPYAQPDQFVRLIDGVFVDDTASCGASFAEVGRGLAAGDYDNDGDVDLLVANNGGPLRLLRNNNGAGNGWLGVDARCASGRRVAIGARITVTVAGKSLTREVRPQQSYLSSGDPRVHFGLGSAQQADRVEILWLDGTRSVRSGVPANQYLTVVEGQQ